MDASPDDSALCRPVRRWWYALAAVALLVGGALAHLWYLTHNCPLDLSGDEAHYWEWARRLDLSYYSKGPLVAYIIALSRPLLAQWSQRIVGNEALAVRVPALLLAIGTGLGIYTLALQTLRSSRLALAAIALTGTVPILACGAMLMTIDAPLAFLYVWALVAIERGLRSGRISPWIVAGVLIALGLLAKYTMLLIFPVVALTLLAAPSFRGVLRRPGPYVAIALGLVGLVPILIWNAQHNWVSFRHVAGQAGLTAGRTFDPLGPASFIAGQAAVIGPIWFAALLWALVAVGRNPRPQSGEDYDPAAARLFVCATVTPWIVFLAFSPLAKIQPNWPLLALPPGIIVLVLWLSRRLRAPRAETRRSARVLIIAGAAIGAASVIVIHHTEWLMPAFAWLGRHEPAWNLTPAAKFDPTARLRGWSQLGAAVGRVLESERAAGREPFIMTDEYQTASEIAFYCPGHPTVYCVQAALGFRQSQYDLWPNPVREATQFIGRPCIYVGALRPKLIGKGESSHVVLPGVRLAETVEHRVRGQLIRVWPIYMCDRFAGFPAELTRSLNRY